MSKLRPLLFVAALLAIISQAAFAATEPKVIFSEKCAMCHGKDGKAQTEMGKKIGAKDLTSQEAKSLTDAQIEAQIAKGKGRMPGYEGILTDKEILTLVKYLKTLK